MQVLQPQLFEYIHCLILSFCTLCEKHWVDFDARPVPQPLGQLREVEALQAEADFQMLTAAFHLVRHGHVCQRRREREGRVYSEALWTRLKGTHLRLNKLTGHQRLPVELPEVESDFFQVDQGHLSVLQHGLLIGLGMKTHEAHERAER